MALDIFIHVLMTWAVHKWSPIPTMKCEPPLISTDCPKSCTYQSFILTDCEVYINWLPQGGPQQMWSNMYELNCTACRAELQPSYILTMQYVSLTNIVYTHIAATISISIVWLVRLQSERFSSNQANRPLQKRGPHGVHTEYKDYHWISPNKYKKINKKKASDRSPCNARQESLQLKTLIQLLHSFPLGGRFSNHGDVMKEYIDKQMKEDRTVCPRSARQSLSQAAVLKSGVVGTKSWRKDRNLSNSSSSCLDFWTRLISSEPLLWSASARSGLSWSNSFSIFRHAWLFTAMSCNNASFRLKAICNSVSMSSMMRPSAWLARRNAIQSPSSCCCSALSSFTLCTKPSLSLNAWSTVGTEWSC